MEEKGSFIFLIVAVSILIIGHFAFGTVSNSIPQTNTYNNNTVSTVGTVTGLIPMLIMIIAVMFVIGFVTWYVSSPTNFAKGHKYLFKVLYFLDKTTYYFAFGLFAYAIFGSIAVATYLLIRLSTIAGKSGLGFEIGKWILIIISFYFGTAVIGYLFHKYIWKKYKQRKEEIEALSNIKELPGVTE